MIEIEVHTVREFRTKFVFLRLFPVYFFIGLLQKLLFYKLMKGKNDQQIYSYIDVLFW